MPKVSVIIPTYNREKYIAVCLDSVLAQTFTDYEIIIVDDGSTDSSPETLREYAARDARIIVIRQENSGKPSIARNTGIRHSTGEFVTFIDSDDLYEPTKLERECEILDKFPDINVVFSDMFLTSENGDKFPMTFLQEYNFHFLARNLLTPIGDDLYICSTSFYNFMSYQFWPLTTQTVMIRRTRLFQEREWFPESMVVCEDIDLWSRLVIGSKILLIDKPLATYRKHSGSISRNREIGMLGISNVHSINYERGQYVLSSAEKKKIRELISQENFDLGFHYKQTRRYRESNAKYMKSIKYHFSARTILALVKLYVSIFIHSFAKVFHERGL